VATCYTDPSLARRELGWQATRGLEEMCADAWRWQASNPNGFGDLRPHECKMENGKDGGRKSDDARGKEPRGACLARLEKE